MITFVCFVLLVALFVKFLQALGEKWGIFSFLQAHAPNDFFYKLFSCAFCRGFWLALGVCGVLVLFGAPLYFLIIPIFSSVL